MRGLHRYELGVRVPTESIVRTAVKPDVLHAFAPTVRAIVDYRNRRVVQQGVFWYSWRRMQQDGGSVWLLVFFDAFPLLGIVYPPGVTPRE